MRLVDTTLLHPAFRDRLVVLGARLRVEGLPLKLYEGARTPFRQAELFARGRCVPGTKIVTRARAWQSYHQYGLAADYVFQTDGWTWDEPRPGAWARYTEIAKGLGLDVLSFERPHVQYPWHLVDLQRGIFPPHGDHTWRSWLGQQIETWGLDERNQSGALHPGAPPAFDIDERPEAGIA